MECHPIERVRVGTWLKKRNLKKSRYSDSTFLSDSTMCARVNERPDKEHVSMSEEMLYNEMPSFDKSIKEKHIE